MSAMTMKEKIAAKRGEIAADQNKNQRVYGWKPGKTIFRIIPAKDGGDWERKFGKMWLKSFDGQKKFTIGDRDITYDEADPVKDMIFRGMAAAPTPEVKDHYREMLASTRYVFQVLIITVNGAPDPDAPPTEPQIVDVSQTQMGNLFAQFDAYCDMDPDYDLAGQEGGHLFSCEKSGKGLDTKYTFLATPQKAPIKQAIVDDQIDIDAWIKSEFDGLEEKAFEFLGRLNGAAGISIAAPNASQAIADQSKAGATSGASETPPAETGMSDAAVTNAVEEEVQDAEYEEVTPEPEAESPFATEPESTPTPTPADKPVEKPAETAAAKDAAQSTDIDDILAGLQ